MFIRPVMSLHGLKTTLDYGADRIRDLSPVPAVSRLRARVGIAKAEEMPPNGLRVHYHLVIEFEAPRFRSGRPAVDPGQRNPPLRP